MEGHYRGKDGRCHPLSELPPEDQETVARLVDEMLGPDEARERALQENRRRSEVLARTRPKL